MKNALPDESLGLYEMDVMSNTMHSKFTAINEQETRYDADFKYTVNKLLMRIMFFFMSGKIKSETQKWLDNFRDFVEAQPD